jgi:hypothetical protein
MTHNKKSNQKNNFKYISPEKDINWVENVANQVQLQKLELRKEHYSNLIW